MNSPAPPKTTVKGIKGPIAVTALAMSLVGLLALHEGDVRKPYKDQVGVWTVCRGVTGPSVIPGKTYTAAECNSLEMAYVAQMARKMDACVRTPLSFDEWMAYGHWSYNVGTSAFCTSTLVKKLNAGDRRGACYEMGRWTFIKINGVSVNCRNPKYKCGGIPTRRDFEVNMCLKAVQGAAL